MEAIILLSLAATIAWLFWRYGYNSKKLRTIRAWRARYKALTAKVSAFTAVEPSVEDQGHDLTSMFVEITETYKKLMEETQWIDDASNWHWTNMALESVFDDAYKVSQMWNEHLAKRQAFYSEHVNS